MDDNLKYQIFLIIFVVIYRNVSFAIVCFRFVDEKFSRYFLLIVSSYKVFKTNLLFVKHTLFSNTGYYTTSTQDYDIKWTMPQCVLTLRLIGLAFNLWDGQKREVRNAIFFIILLSRSLRGITITMLQEELSDSQKRFALKERPSLLEIAAYAYFPGAFLIGPQFSMRRYLDYINGQLTDRVC